MRIVHIALVICLLLAVVGASTTALGQQNINVAVKRASPLACGLPYSAYVFVNGTRAMHIPASASGMVPLKRAEIVAGRLKSAFASGMAWESMRVAYVNRNWVVAAKDTMIITADKNSACAFRTSEGGLASRWAKQTVVALGGNPKLIAAQLRPVKQMVAGAIQEKGVCPPKAIKWINSPTKTVMLIDADSGEEIGSVMVAGEQTQLNMVNAVAVYTMASSDQVIYSFVPITSASMSSQPMRVQGVGLVSIPANMVSMQGILTGDQAASRITSMLSQWNRAINAKFMNCDVRLLNGTSKVVPLYSADMNAIVGAAQVVGSASAIANTKSVFVSSSDDMLAFLASSTSCVPVGGAPEMLNNVLVSSIIVVPSGETPGPSPELTTPPEPTPPPCPPDAQTCPSPSGPPRACPSSSP